MLLLALTAQHQHLQSHQAIHKFMLSVGVLAVVVALAETAEVCQCRAQVGDLPDKLAEQALLAEHKYPVRQGVLHYKVHPTALAVAADILVAALAEIQVITFQVLEAGQGTLIQHTYHQG